MSVVIRLAKIGKRGTRIFRIVAIEKTHKRDSMPLAILGTYVPSRVGNTKANGAEIVLDKQKLLLWQSKGAKLSPAVERILQSPL